MNSSVWEPLLRAIKTNRAIKIMYRAPGYDENIERLLHPYFLLNNQDLWYILAYNRIRDRVETYAVHRIKAIEILSESFSIPPDFNFNDFIDPLWGIFSKDKKFRVVIEFEGGASARVRERTWPERYKLSLMKGKTRLQIETNQLESVMFWILPWGAEAKVIEPLQLRNMIKETAEAVIRKYN